MAGGNLIGQIQPKPGGGSGLSGGGEGEGDEEGGVREGKRKEKSARD